MPRQRRPAVRRLHCRADRSVWLGLQRTAAGWIVADLNHRAREGQLLMVETEILPRLP
jgi:hypothetical protein